MNKEEMREIPQSISDSLMRAIGQSLREEKVPVQKRMLRVFGFASLVALSLACVIFYFYSHQLSVMWGVACMSLWIFLLVGFYFYFYPQPRLAVRGYWTKWVFAKLMLAMTVITALELVICPHFVFVHVDVPRFNIFSALTSQYMAWGGMSGCMFLCGVTFTGIAALLSFFLVSKTLSGGSWKAMLIAVGIALFAQLPIMIIQLSEAHLQPYFPYWLGGSALSILVIAVVVRAMGQIKLKFFQA